MKRILIISIVLCAFNACKNKTEKIKPMTQNITESVYASGVIKSLNQYQVFSTVNGILQNIYVKEGDSILEGSPIVSIFNETSKLNSENAALAAEFSDYGKNKSKINELNINLELSRKKMQLDSILWMRQKSLWNQNIGSKLELEQRELAYRNSATAYEAAGLRLIDLEKQLKFSSLQSKKNLQISQRQSADFTVNSEFNGKVYSLLKKKGEMISIQTPLAIIGDVETFIIELQVDEYDIAKIKNGLQVFITLDSYKDSLFEATISKIYPMMNERSKTFTVEAVFTHRPKSLFPNLTVEANIVINKKVNAITIPRKFLINDSFVFLSDGKKQTVKTGLMDYSKVEILSGVGLKDELVLPK